MAQYYGTMADKAFAAAYRLVSACEAAGVDLTDPDGIARGVYDRYLPDDMSYCSGASRLVIWDEYCDFIIKLPLYDTCERYCDREVEIYEDAIRQGWTDQFAWCACYQRSDWVDDIYIPGIYVMEYIYCNEEDVYDSAWKYGYEAYCRERGLDSSTYDAAEEYNDWNYADDDDMVLDCIEAQLLDDDVRRAFCVFMRKWTINDIHCGNAGLKGDKMVLVDYGGWNWQKGVTMKFYITNMRGDEIFDIIEAEGLAEACDIASQKYEDGEADIYYADHWEELYEKGEL